MKSFQKQIIKANVAPWQLNINFKLYSFLQDSVWILVLFHIDLLTNEAVFTGWNPSGTAVYLYMTFGAAEAQLTLTLFPIPWTKPRTLWLRMFILCKEKTSYILILTGYRSLKMRVQNCHNTAGLLWPRWNASWKHNQYYQNTGFVE